MTKDPNFTVNNADRELLDLILDRAMAFAAGQQGPRIARIDLDMDLTFTHANIVPLDLARLAASHLRDLTHDVFGIRRYLDRDKGVLTECWTPRHAAREPVAFKAATIEDELAG